MEINYNGVSINVQDQTRVKKILAVVTDINLPGRPRLENSTGESPAPKKYGRYNRYKPYSKEEVDIILARRAERVPVRKIAHELGRTPGALHGFIMKGLQRKMTKLGVQSPAPTHVPVDVSQTH